MPAIVTSAGPVDFYWTDIYLADPRRMAEIRSRTEAGPRTMVAEVRSDPGSAGTESIPIDVRFVPGPPAEQWVHQSHGADLLVWGSRGRSGMRSTLLGSVALHCAAHARCPVVVVHPFQPAPGSPVVGSDGTPRHRTRCAGASTSTSSPHSCRTARPAVRVHARTGS